MYTLTSQKMHDGSFEAWQFIKEISWISEKKVNSVVLPNSQLNLAIYKKVKYSWNTAFPIRGFLPSTERAYHRFCSLEVHEKMILIWSNLR